MGNVMKDESRIYRGYQDLNDKDSANLLVGHPAL